MTLQQIFGVYTVKFLGATLHFGCGITELAMQLGQTQVAGIMRGCMETSLW